MLDPINNSYLEYLERKKQREKIILFLGRFTVVGGSIVSLILLADILSRH